MCIHNIAHDKKLEKGLYEAEMLLSCVHCIQLWIVLVLVYKKNDPPLTIKNITQAQKAVQSTLIRIETRNKLFL